MIHKPSSELFHCINHVKTRLNVYFLHKKTRPNKVRMEEVENLKAKQSVQM